MLVVDYVTTNLAITKGIFNSKKVIMNSPETLRE